jgi:branched-chain amino acid transport system substrate-binding protein
VKSTVSGCGNGSGSRFASTSWGDSASSASGALTAAQKLVQVDKVFAIINNTSFLFGAQPFLLKNKIPVVSGAVASDLVIDPKTDEHFRV